MRSADLLRDSFHSMFAIHRMIATKAEAYDVLWGPIDLVERKKSSCLSEASSLKLDYFSLWHNSSKLDFCSLSFRNSSALLVSEGKHGSQNIVSRGCSCKQNIVRRGCSCNQIIISKNPLAASADRNPRGRSSAVRSPCASSVPAPPSSRGP